MADIVDEVTKSVEKEVAAVVAEETVEKTVTNGDGEEKTAAAAAANVEETVDVVDEGKTKEVAEKESNGETVTVATVVKEATENGTVKENGDAEVTEKKTVDEKEVVDGKETVGEVCGIKRKSDVIAESETIELIDPGKKHKIDIIEELAANGDSA